MTDGAKSRFLLNLAEMIVGSAKACGADEAEATVSDGREFDVDVRRGRIENLVEAGSRVVSFRIIKDGKTAHAATSDLKPETISRLVGNAVRRAELGSADEYAGLPPLASERVDIPSLRLSDPDVPSLKPDRKIRLALETERIALQDRRITNSHGASFISHEVTTALAASNGFSGSYDQTFCSLSVGLQAGDTDRRVEDDWVSVDRFFKNLESPETVAKKAVERTVRQLNPRKIRTQTVPVVFEPGMTDWLVGFLFSCVSAVAVYQKTTFLAGRLGERIGNDALTVIDDALLPGKLGSRPFDSEGVPCRKTTVFEQGILRQYLSNTYAGRKLGLPSTGNSDGGGIGPNNFFLVPGTFSPKEIIASLDKGFVLTRTIGHGLNPVTGDISRGAFGLWVEGGEVAFPVSEVTISGNLGEILSRVEMVGNDLDFRSPVCGPTIKIGALTVAGE
ncbi:MAG: microcin-processing peptidase 1 [Candidatus Aminicenantes bacterium]|nr:microcin-processing peptidase 1 [Candidatus Aminicenantes bacterium]